MTKKKTKVINLTKLFKLNQHFKILIEIYFFFYLGEDEAKSSRKSDCLKEPELTLYWNFTQSMLRNVGCLPLERIHAWLKRYANADITVEQTKYLCDFKIKEQLLKMTGGLYRLNK